MEKGGSTMRRAQIAHRSLVGLRPRCRWSAGQAKWVGAHRPALKACIDQRCRRKGAPDATQYLEPLPNGRRGLSSEESRVGKACVSTGRSRRAQAHTNTKTKAQTNYQDQYTN